MRVIGGYFAQAVLKERLFLSVNRLISQAPPAAPLPVRPAPKGSPGLAIVRPHTLRFHALRQRIHPPSPQPIATRPSTLSPDTTAPLPRPLHSPDTHTATPDTATRPPDPAIQTLLQRSPAPGRIIRPRTTRTPSRPLPPQSRPSSAHRQATHIRRKLVHAPSTPQSPAPGESSGHKPISPHIPANDSPKRTTGHNAT